MANAASASATVARPYVKSPLCNRDVHIDGMTYKNGEWTGGRIYDPTSGKSYKLTITFKDAKTLKLRGYIGVEALGETMYWTKIQ